MNTTKNAFHEERFATAQDALQRGLNEKFWRHGIDISQGNGMNVSEKEATRRLNSIRRHLGRQMFGNHWREKGKIVFMVFGHGSRKSDDEHYHALLGIRGDHNWSNFKIAMTIKSIELMRHLRTERYWEKMAHVDWDWKKKGNRYHGYVGRFANSRPDDWKII
jgi:hypothetical protein